MKWPSLRRHDSKTDAATAGQTAADKALVKAEKELAEVNSQTSEILETAADLKRLGERNNFADMIKEALGGK